MWFHHDSWMTCLHKDWRFRLVEAKHQANDNDSCDESGVWRGKSKFVRFRPLLWDWQSNHFPEPPISPRQIAEFFNVFIGESNLCQLWGTGALLVLTFVTSAVANRVANRILLARDLVKKRWVQMIQMAHSLQDRSISLVPGPYGKAQPFPFAGHECCPVPFPRQLSGGSALMECSREVTQYMNVQ